MIFYGRKPITADVERITADNVIGVISNAAIIHGENIQDMDVLYNYYKGKQNILYRTKRVRPEINNKVVENRANEIVSFKTGYLVGEPIQYVSKLTDASSTEISRLNTIMDMAGKQSEDADLSDNMHIFGTGYRLVLPDDDIPFGITTVDPREAFVVYSADVFHKPLAGVIALKKKINNAETLPVYTVYTDKEIFVIEDGKLTEKKSHIIGYIPLIEYPLNKARIGSFETVMSLLDAINEFESNRMDAVAQFVQSLLILKNCAVEEGTTAQDIMQAGLIELKSDGTNSADIVELAKQLDQSQNQTLKDDLHRAVLEIVGMPSQSDGSGSDSSNNGAVIIRNGWQSAEARAKRTEMQWKNAERKMLCVVLNILDATPDRLKLTAQDIDIKFTRHQYQALSEKTTALTQMLGNDKIDPRDAWVLSGLSIDAEECYRRGMAWFEKQTANEQKKAELAAQVEIVKAQQQQTEKETEQPNGGDEQ